MRLTEATVKAIAPAPKGKGYTVTYDGGPGGVPGFGVRTTETGAKSFVLKYKIKGRSRTMTIGTVGPWSVVNARTEAGRLKQQVQTGSDPQTERQQERAAPTIPRLVERYSAEHLVTKKPRGAEEDRLMIAQHILPRFRPMRVDAVRRAGIEAWHRTISKTTPTRANRVMALLSKMFSLAVQWEWRTDNPCRGVKKNPENRRERFLSPTEIARLMAALTASPYKSSANAVMLLLLTGARRNEVLGAEWNEFDLERGIWLKPSARTKSGQAHRVPLSMPAIELLTVMKA